MKINLVKIAILAIIVFSIGFVACEEEDDYTANLIQKEIDDRKEFLGNNSITDSSKTASGMYYIKTEEGIGDQAVIEDKVSVHYIGKFLNGTIFYSSYDWNKPIGFTLGVGEVIPGWDEAIALMKVGGKADLIIPSNLAYGATGYGSIPPYATLIFNVELVEINNK